MADSDASDLLSSYLQAWLRTHVAVDLRPTTADTYGRLAAVAGRRRRHAIDPIPKYIVFLAMRTYHVPKYRSHGGVRTVSPAPCHDDARVVGQAGRRGSLCLGKDRLWREP
ncbi:MAG: hypothetical protein M0Z66_16490 [Thermaerobacter sp.]|nr:hypothetical protein [Thermaerobacter sp.]